MYNMDPSYLSNVFQPLKGVHQIVIRGISANRRLPNVMTNMGQRSFSYQGAVVLKKLEAEEKMVASFHSLKCWLDQP